nr:hypothetical protein 17 [Desulfobacterales bacterium]
MITTPAKYEGEHTEANCDCIFCATRCPKCGSIYIGINFHINIHLDNSESDKMWIYGVPCEIELECHECDEVFNDEDVEYEYRLDLHRLRIELIKCINPPYEKEIRLSETGAITSVTEWFNDAVIEEIEESENEHVGI